MHGKKSINVIDISLKVFLVKHIKVLYFNKKKPSMKRHEMLKRRRFTSRGCFLLSLIIFFIIVITK